MIKNVESVKDYENLVAFVKSIRADIECKHDEVPTLENYFESLDAWLNDLIGSEIEQRFLDKDPEFYRLVSTILLAGYLYE